MASASDIIADEWAERATELADWAMQRLVNRLDLWGQYAVASRAERERSGKSYRALTLPARAQRGKDRVTLEKLARHFASRRHRRPELIGLHAKSAEGTSRWFGIDLDVHDVDAPEAPDLARRNLDAATAWLDTLRARGHDPLLFDSNGAGGLHLWVLFAEPAATSAVYECVRELTADWQSRELARRPEVFPKREQPGRPGAWFRLPGLHHTFEHHSRLWAGDDGSDEPWLAGHAAVDGMLAAIPGPPPTTSAARALAPPRRAAADARPGDPRAAAPRRRPRAARPRVCIDLDGVLAARIDGTGLGPPLEGAVEFTRCLSHDVDLIVHSARFSTRSGKPRSAAATQALHARIERWLASHGFVWHAIATGTAKPIAAAYIDDRAVPCRPSQEGVAAFDRALEAVQALAEH